ncbi:MAG: hypothetical protein CYG59_04135 [Chloroflexi bacterium]|nr:MAG: hypothetical protein CYG59_04135 [Chloroflexota bacterium]
MRLFSTLKGVGLLYRKSRWPSFLASAYAFQAWVRRTYAYHRPLLALLLTLGLLSSTMSRPTDERFATGLNQPRGMAFDEDGNLLVAEAGVVGASALGDAPILSNISGRVVRIAPSGQATEVLNGLPHTHYRDSGIAVGAADVVMLDGTLYVLTGEGYEPLSRAILLNTTAGPRLVASILNFSMSRSSLGQMIGPNAIPANPYAMVVAPDARALYIADGAAGRVLRVTLDGHIDVFAEVPKLVPLTGLAFGPDRKLYLTEFGGLPHSPGSGAIWTADPSGKLEIVASGLTMPIDVGFDAAGTMYVLEFGDGRNPARPYPAHRGRLLRIEQNGTQVVVREGLNYPTAMVFSEAGDLFLAVNGAFTRRQQGMILKIPCGMLGTQEGCPRQFMQ